MLILFKRRVEIYKRLTLLSYSGEDAINVNFLYQVKIKS